MRFAGYWRMRGIRTVDADAVGHLVLAGEGLAPVAERWPDVVLEGQIDRQALARIVFDDPGELKVLEAITHPLIFGRIEADLKGFSGVVVVEMPLLETSMGWPVIVVDADDETRLRRAVQRGMERSRCPPSNGISTQQGGVARGRRRSGAKSRRNPASGGGGGTAGRLSPTGIADGSCPRPPVASDSARIQDRVRFRSGR